jgi:transcriptional regulator with XRE-family HTH domain
LEVSIGTNIKATRLQAGLTQVQLARVAGIPQGTIASYENDAQTPSAVKLAALAKALNVPMEALVGLEEAKRAPLEASDNRVHGNSTAAQIQKLVGQLDREAQKVILKQAKMMLPHHTEAPKRSKAA